MRPFPGAGQSAAEKNLGTYDATGKRITAFDTLGIATEGYKGPKVRTEAADS